MSALLIGDRQVWPRWTMSSVPSESEKVKERQNSTGARNVGGHGCERYFFHDHGEVEPQRGFILSCEPSRFDCWPIVGESDQVQRDWWYLSWPGSGGTFQRNTHFHCSSHGWRTPSISPPRTHSAPWNTSQNSWHCFSKNKKGSNPALTERQTFQSVTTLRLHFASMLSSFYAITEISLCSCGGAGHRGKLASLILIMETRRSIY